jgi:hypothetical protein
MNIKIREQKKWLFLPLSMLLLVGCEKVIFEPVVIPNTDKSFVNDIQPILEANCVKCHPPTKGLDLNASTSYNALVPKYAAPADSSNPKASKLYIKLTGTAHKPRTDDAQKQTIEKWISQGVPNN